ncbi:hypothetical protein HLK59_05030 [Streptomyces sp. S3(2020)]|uniref:DUF5666 domain-containing protein n=1 Tax=Streptomyces sp. S3(2020) TaxID=2732044 RepID=UPI00148923BD|nr:DUF5666 domain-containing protein [Streptomyces sp. S3(2020)]NNN29730.1 hypothetical protein [Streptomyces sp. S3(2020)]
MTHDPDQEATPPEILVGPGEHTALRDRWRRRSVRARAVTAAAAVAALTLGGTVVAYAATSSGSDGGATPAASGSPSASPHAPGERHGPGWRFGVGVGGDAAHGEATVKDRDTGEWVVRVWQRGTVEKVDGDQVTVKSEDGARWTWTVNADTTVLREGAKGSGADDLKQDETVQVAGTRSDGGTRTASHVLAGTWERKGPENWRDRLPGHGHREWPKPDPTKSGTTA